MIPVVALIGRENVGKSTLFNYLTATRAALVSDFPGMTRDRQYGEANIADHRFIVIDTGGLTQEKDPIHELTTSQALLAIEEADKIIFVVDGREGLLNQDVIIAEKLRRINKPIFVAINKAEDLDKDIISTEFYPLGFGNPCAISAVHRRGIDELIGLLFPEKIETITDEDDDVHGIKVALVGKPNAGKSTLTNRLLGESRVIVYDQPGTTRDSIFIPFIHHEQSYTLIDTAGIRRRGKVFEAVEKFSIVKTLQAISAANVVLLVIDAHEGLTEQDLRLIGFVLESGRALVIAINKWDGLTEYDKNQVRSAIDRRLKFIPFIRIQFISALHGTGVGHLYKYIDEAYHSATKKLNTTQLSKWLELAVKTHEPPLVRGRRIKLRFAHPGGSNPPTIIIHGNQVNALPDSYKTYLAHFFQERLKLMGTPVRIEFKTSENPFRHKRNTLTPRQQRKKKRIQRRK